MEAIVHLTTVAVLGVLSTVGFSCRPVASDAGRVSVMRAASTVPIALPAPPAQSEASVARVALGTFFSCAVSNDGRVRCWGDNRNGTIGRPMLDNFEGREAVAHADVPVGRPVATLATGLRHACAVTRDGELACWGRWELGSYARAPTDQVGWPALEVAVRGAAAGNFHTCVLTAFGAVRCWGTAREGALGYGNAQDVESSALSTIGDVPVGALVRQIVAGDNFTCALLEAGGVRCWGVDAIGYPGKSRIGASDSPSEAGDVSVGGLVTELAAGGGHVCALLPDGDVRCWGDNASGELGYGDEFSSGEHEAPSEKGPIDLGAPALHIAAGGAHTCAIITGGRVRCWGAGEFGRLGYGNTASIGDDEHPAGAGDVDVGGEAIQVAAGGFHTCVLLKTGCVRCWGQGAHGQLGYGNTNDIGDDETPASQPCVSVFGE